MELAILHIKNNYNNIKVKMRGGIFCFAETETLKMTDS